MGKLKNIEDVIHEFEEFTIQTMARYILYGNVLDGASADLTAIMIGYLRKAVELDLIELNKNKRNEVKKCLGCLN